MNEEKRLIDANALIQKHGSDVTNWDKPYAVKISSIENAPTVDAVEVVHGRWRIETDEEEPNPMFKLVVCSVCDGKASGTYNYCPNCGARMDGDSQ